MTMITKETGDQMKKRRKEGTKERGITAVVKMNQGKEERETKRRNEGAPVAVRMMKE